MLDSKPHAVEFNYDANGDESSNHSNHNEHMTIEETKRKPKGEP